MSSETAQFLLISTEIALLLAGAALFIWLLGRTPRTHWLTQNRLPLWPISMIEFGLFLFLIFGAASFGQLAMQALLGKKIADAVDSQGLGIFLYGLGFSGGSIIGWCLFPLFHRMLHTNYGAEPPAVIRPAEKMSLFAASRAGAFTLAVALPIVTLCSLGWGLVIRKLGLPEDQQPLIAIFEQTKSPWVLIGMLVAACVFAPIGEELLFRAGIFRFFRQKIGRVMAVVLSGLLFGAVHGNWAGLIPLATLGAVLAVAYEATGDIRVPIIAHALFNLNTVILVLSGLSKTVQ